MKLKPTPRLKTHLTNIDKSAYSEGEKRNKKTWRADQRPQI